MPDTINSRIALVLKGSKLNQTKFAESLGIKQSTVSMIVAGKTGVSDRTISDICRIYHVSELWLRTGEGEMYSETAEEDAMLATFSAAARSTSTAKQRLLRAIARMPEECFPAIEQLLLELVKENEPTDPSKT